MATFSAPSGLDSLDLIFILKDSSIITVHIIGGQNVANLSGLSDLVRWILNLNTRFVSSGIFPLFITEHIIGGQSHYSSTNLHS